MISINQLAHNPLAKDVISDQAGMFLMKFGWTPTYRADPEQWAATLTTLGFARFPAWNTCMRLFGGLDINLVPLFSTETFRDMLIFRQKATSYPSSINLTLNHAQIKREAKSWQTTFKDYANLHIAPIGMTDEGPLFILSNGWIVIGFIEDLTGGGSVGLIDVWKLWRMFFRPKVHFMVKGQTIFQFLNRCCNAAYLAPYSDE